MRGGGVVDANDDWSSDDEQKDEILWGQRIKCAAALDDDKSDCTEVEDVEDDEEEASEDYELQSFLEETPEFRAKVQYQVRIVALMPGFQAAGRKEALFSDFYTQRFGKSLVENTGFSSATMICRSMPHVIQRDILDDRGEVVLVDSAKNMRVVAGIRSGLRRIVYNILKLHTKGLSAQSLDQECSKAVSRPLTTVLAELSYDTPSVECLVRDMADIASCKQTFGVNKFFLSSEAEDPALSDGILLCPVVSSGTGFINEGKVPRLVANDDILQARFRLIVLLTLHSDGVAIDRLQKVYTGMYLESLDPSLLGFDSLKELVMSWNDFILVQGSDCPEKVFLRQSQGTSRLLDSLKSGLRLNIFSMLLASYPDGLEPAELLRQLQESQSQQVLEALVAHGFVVADGMDAEELQSAALHMLCYVVHDMMDFIRFGCRDDGTVLIKLRDSGFPVLDFPDCDDEEDDDFVKLFMEGELVLTPRVNEHVKFPSQESSFSDDSSFQDEAITGCIVPDVLEHQIRLILGSPIHLHEGMKLDELIQVYRDRTGTPLAVSEFKAFVASRPGIVRMIKGTLRLVESPKNLRIVSVTMAGLRQVLYWSLLKNTSGVWSEMLEGWFLDFTGFSLTSVLATHGYRTSERQPLLPVSDFLEDMTDICKSHEGKIKFYMLASNDDPCEADARLLFMDLESIQYDPVKLCNAMLESNICHNGGISEVASISEDDLSENDHYDPPKAYATPLIVAQ